MPARATSRGLPRGIQKHRSSTQYSAFRQDGHCVIKVCRYINNMDVLYIPVV